MALVWDERLINKLKELVDRDLSATQIGEIFGSTKNAIIGKCSRLGFTLHGSTGSARKRRHLIKQPKKLKKRLHLKPLNKESSIKVKARKFLKAKSKMSNGDKAIGMDEFYKRLGIPPIPDDNCCHHISGDDIKNGNHSWCGRPTHKKSMYCDFHYERAYVTSSYKSKPSNYLPPRSPYIR